VSSLAGRRVVVATGNPGKLREIEAIVGDRDFALVDLSGVGAVAFPEEGDDYAANAIAQARAAAEQLGEMALADDSGLEVEGLGGGPGARSARFGGAGLDDASRYRHLLARLAETPGASRRARFVCHVALVTPDGDVTTAVGECRGAILEAPRGEGGFGYDPVFEVEDTGRTMAELPAGEKNRISHRARALASLFERLA
jgi:XTP/dITP diphosphohydrolase